MRRWPSRRWLLIFSITFAMGAGAFTFAGWRGWLIFAASSIYGLIVGTVEPIRPTP